MATAKKLSDLTSLTDIDESDLLLAVDISDKTSAATGTTKKVLFSEIKNDIKADLNITNWNTAYGWGNHADAGYLTSSSLTETDPVFTASAAYGITSTKTAQWDAAYGWGNHAVQGYLQSIATQNINSLNDVEIDSDTLTTNQVLKWNGTSWINGTGGAGTTINGLNDVGDVNITSLADNHILRYDSATEKWKNEEDISISLTSLSVTTATAASSSSLSYNSATGVFTYTPPAISSFEVVDDTSPQLGGDLSLNSNDITGTGDINITGEVKCDSFNVKTNNDTIAGTNGNNRDIKVIGGAPFYYDGTAWREFYLINGSVTTLQPDTDWGNVMIRSTFDTDFTDVKYNVTPGAYYGTSSVATADEISVVSAPVKVGVKSLKINSGSGAYSRLQYPFTSNYDFTGAWTMEAWVNIDTESWGTTAQSIFSGAGSSSDFSLLVRRAGSYSNAIFSWYNYNNNSHDSVNGSDIVEINQSIIVGAWCHVALVRSPIDAKIRLYLNGTIGTNTITDNDIANPDQFSLGGSVGSLAYNRSFDGFLDDVRISKSARYSQNFTPQTTQLPVTGSTTQIISRPTSVRGEITLGTSPTWKGTSGVTASRQASGLYRLTFTTSYTNNNDYLVHAQPMNQGSASYISVTRSTTHVDFAINKQSDDNAVDTGSLAVEITNHV